MKKKLAILFLGIILLVSGTVVSAKSTYVGYSVVVPKFNGYASAGSQQKMTTSPADLRVSRLGKAVDARETGSTTSRTGSWVRVSSTSSYKLPSKVPGGGNYYSSLSFSNDLTTTVDVLVSGEWRNN